jgi:hypothetical protein
MVSSMADIPRQRSPRAPSIDLGEAVEKVRAIYEKQRLHAGPTDVVAQHLGYKNANNGAAVQVIASLRYYGLIERPQDGMLAVTKDVEEFQYVPSDQARQGILRRWLTAPPVFSQLLVKYEAGLPADLNLRFDLIQLGFSPGAAETLIPVLRRSVDYAGYFAHQAEVEGDRVPGDEPPAQEPAISPGLREPTQTPTKPKEQLLVGSDSALDQIPVRLPGGRRAWLAIPSPFFAADKIRLKAQIDLLLTDDEESPEGKT